MTSGSSTPFDAETYLSLDDTTVWGALPALCDADDKQIKELALRLRDRRLYKCIDIKAFVRDESKDSDQRLVEKRCSAAFESIRQYLDENAASHRVLLDRVSREPYKRGGGSKRPLNQLSAVSTPRRLPDIVGPVD